jgi:hypothetical protein
MKKRKKVLEQLLNLFLISVLVLTFILLLNNVIAVVPEGVSTINVTSNETKTPGTGEKINISGGRIAELNLSATVQNPHWKAFVGWVNGEYTLDDAGGSTIYTWSSTVTGGRIYTTRNSSTPLWTIINCSNTTHLSIEDYDMNHTGADNITSTFNETGKHSSFYIGDVFIYADTCPTLSTYVNNNSQTDGTGTDDFEQMALYDNASIIYASVLEDDEVGYNGENYDFQLLVPENGISGTTVTAYYLYIEITM